MIKSMTAFANAEQRTDGLHLSWELRSVNHRYLDASIYLPESFAALEASLKEEARKILSRGKLDARLVYKPLDDAGEAPMSLNQNLVKKLFDAEKRLLDIAMESEVKKLRPLSSMELLQYPGVLASTEFDYSRCNDSVIALFKQALGELVQSRAEEGERLKALLLSRAESIQTLVEKVRQHRPQVLAALREKVMKKLAEIDIEADNNRLEQELVFQAQRLDVDEELDRLDSHIQELQAVLERTEPVGRRLDFLMQELNREANTLGSKANDAETTQCSVELKVLIEQMREQVMNIE